MRKESKESTERQRRQKQMPRGKKETHKIKRNYTPGLNGELRTVPIKFTTNAFTQLRMEIFVHKEFNVKFWSRIYNFAGFHIQGFFPLNFL